MTYQIRLFQPDDYVAVAALQSQCWPEYPITADELRFEDEHRPAHCKCERWVAIDDQHIVGNAGYEQIAGRYHPGKFWLSFFVDPTRQGQGLGAALYEQVITTVKQYDPWLVRVAFREDMLACRRFVERRGFAEDWRSWESRLDVTQFDPQPFADYQERIAHHNICIKSFRELAADPERNRKLYDLIEATRRDAPMRDTATSPDFEAWVKSNLLGPYMDEDAYFIAVRDGQYVGLSSLMTAKSDQVVETGWTGVARAARGLGIAQALKLRVIEYARERGYTVIRTDNNSLNHPMLAINQKLGFVRYPAWVYYVKYLRPER